MPPGASINIPGSRILDAGVEWTPLTFPAGIGEEQWPKGRPVLEVNPSDSKLTREFEQTADRPSFTIS
jgi:hypothetical protein